MRFILCLLLALGTAPASAEWVEMGMVAGNITVYIDPTRVRMNGNFHKVWLLYDLKQRHKDGQMSMRLLQEFDCKEERYRILALSTHSEPMASGEMLLSTDDPGKWNAIPPNSSAEANLKFVCAK